jgi:pimeloyl-ACP methyl ester carboxylesterase
LSAAEINPTGDRLIWFWIALIVAALLLAIAHGFSLLFRNKRTPHSRTPHDLDLPFEEIRFPTRRNKHLYGWWVPAENRQPAPVIILVHGWSRNVERLLPFIEMLHPLGVHLLAFDARHHGSSDPDGFSSMVKFAEDIQAAVTFAEQRGEASVDQIAVLGLSVGGAAAILAASEDRRIRAVITIGAFCHPREAMLTLLEQRGLRPNPLITLAFRYMQWRIGARFDDIAPENRIRRLDIPVFLIHGERDRTVPVEHACRLQKAGGEPATLWVIPGKGHSDCNSHPEFQDRVGAFLSRHLSLVRSTAKPPL